MWTTLVSGTALGLVLMSQAVETRACDSGDSQQSPTPTPPGSSSQVFTARDGARFRVDTVMSELEIPWSLAFAPDDRLFVTERPGRVRILNLTSFTSEVALTLSGVFAQGEAGLLGKIGRAHV